MIVPYYLALRDGRIIATGRCPESAVERQSRDGAIAYAGEASPAHYRHASGDVRLREDWTFPAAATLAADATAVLVLADIPEGSRCTLTGPIEPRSWTEYGGAVEITTNLPGRYSLTVDPPRHRPRTCVITAT